MQKQRRHRQDARRHLPTLLLCGLALSLLLLSACSTSAEKPTSVLPSPPTALPSPNVDPTMKNQANVNLQAFQQWITLMKQNGGNTSTYQQQYDADQQATQNAKTSSDYQAAITALDTHVEAIKLPAMKAEATGLQQKMQQEVTSWGQKHQYYNSYDKTYYPLGLEYGNNGIASWVQGDLDSAKTVADYQQAIENLQMYMANFHALEDNSADQTAYNLPHKADLALIKHYNLTGKVVIVSLLEQSMRLYDNGQLANAFLITTGRPDRPTPPGKWWIESKQYHTTFKAGVPKSSPYWYPDTPINYAMQYHSEGYYLHDSDWRANYGPGTNYPHVDSTGNSSSSQGSHGCVNIALPNAAWVYNFVDFSTAVIIY